MDLYKSAGVDAELGDKLVDWLQTPSGQRSEGCCGKVVEGIGGFASLFRPDFSNIEDPLLVASTDGVGTKLLLAIERNQLQGIGRDLVGMCLNDLYAVGARPLFFLDYFATGKLSEDQFQTVLQSIQAGLLECHCPLVGGETAELPGLYADRHFDLAGFAVGVVDGKRRIGKTTVREGDLVFAFESSGFHSNGYSLIRRWLVERPPHSERIFDNLLQPTRIYAFVPQLLMDLPPQAVSALAHITGGGISGNLGRVVPDALQAVLRKDSLPTPRWMSDWIATQGCSVADVEPVFNLGAGLMAVVAPKYREAFLTAAKRVSGETPCFVGEIQKRMSGDEVVYR